MKPFRNFPHLVYGKCFSNCKYSYVNTIWNAHFYKLIWNSTLRMLIIKKIFFPLFESNKLLGFCDIAVYTLKRRNLSYLFLEKWQKDMWGIIYLLWARRRRKVNDTCAGWGYWLLHLWHRRAIRMMILGLVWREEFN